MEVLLVGREVRSSHVFLCFKRRALLSKASCLQAVCLIDTLMVNIFYKTLVLFALHRIEFYGRLQREWEGSKTGTPVLVGVGIRIICKQTDG